MSEKQAAGATGAAGAAGAARADTERPLVRKIEAAKEMRGVMGTYFSELFEAARTGSPKIAWCTSVGPAELLAACGFRVYFPENHGAMLGATRVATDLIPVANAIGYSPEICSYLTSDVGSYLKGQTPMAKMPGYHFPKPDVLVYNTNQCRDVQEWMSFYQREFNVPMLGVSTPRGIHEVSDVHVEASARQIEAMVEPLIEITGKPFDHDRFKEVVGLSRGLSRKWKAVLEAAAAVPAPINFFDSTIHMGPAVVMRGDQRAIDYYDHLLTELNECIAQGVGSVADERYRLYWEGMPIWGKLRDHSHFLAEHRACVVASTYCNSWIFDAFDPDDPFRSLGRAYTEIFIVRSEEWKAAYIREMIEKYRIHGVVYHDARTCPNNSNNRYGLPERLERETGIPFITISGDLNDLRCYSEEQTATSMEAFIEQLAEG